VEHALRRTRRILATAAATAVAVALPSIALAHPDHGQRDSGSQEQFPGEGVATETDKQHDGDGGHLPARNDNVTLVGKAAIEHPLGGDVTGRVADVFAHGDYAYLTAFNSPTCNAGGVHVMDISDLANPVEVPDAFLPTTAGSYAGEGLQVIRIGERDVLIHQNETCTDAHAPAPGTPRGGINLWDVTDPRNAEPLAMHAGDYTAGGTSTPKPYASTVHSVYAWHNDFDGRTYAVLVDNEEWEDVDIMDISDPTAPVMVNDTLDLVDQFGVGQDSPSGLTSIFNHDMMVYKVGSRYVMNVNYWDGGYVLLDVTDPRPGQVSLIAESDYAALDEERLKRGHEISPEGNAHQSELSPDGRFLIGTDEDFAPYRGVATITSGEHAGTQYTTASASDTPPITSASSVEGTVVPVGLACDADGPLAAGDGGIALVERGVCTFQEKLDNVVDAGYSAGIVFNNTTGCDALVRMGAAGDIPFVFVSRTTGLQLLDVADVSQPCATATPADGVGQSTTITAVFDGWGYVRLFEVDIPKGKKGDAGSIRQLDTYAIDESQDEAFAEGYGDLSVHEVAIDPDQRLAYFSYYAGGLRVASYGKDGLTEVGAFIDEGGNNFWGVEVYQRDGQTYVLASDRDHGLYVFQYTP
jgi:hypothetical protein